MAQTTVSNQIQIRGQPAAIFDLTTTARFWPQWHPATLAVGGVSERPFQLGDELHEQARIGGRIYTGIWRVAAHDRPRTVLLQMGGDRLQIRYEFNAQDDGVLLTRHLTFDPANFATGLSDPTQVVTDMESQSTLALSKLKALVEAILQRETSFSFDSAKEATL
jgi:hypothetical protein